MSPFVTVASKVNDQSAIIIACHNLGLTKPRGTFIAHTNEIEA